MFKTNLFSWILVMGIIVFTSCKKEEFLHSDSVSNAERSSSERTSSYVKGIAGSVSLKAVKADGTGNVYMTGHFFGSITLDGTIRLTSHGYKDVFVAKYDSLGHVIWATSAGATNDDIVNSLAIDASGNAYITGYFSSITTFGSTVLTHSGSGMFVAKFSHSGEILWARSAGGTGTEYGQDIAVDNTGNAYVIGYFSGQAAFGTLSSNGSSDVFVVKYNTSGDLQWTRSTGGTGTEYGQGIAVDESGNAFITGSFSFQSWDTFLSKYNTGGDLQWTKVVGGKGADYGQYIALDGLGNIYLSGYFVNTVTFGSTTLTGAGSNDVFILKCNNSGDVQWARSAGSTGADAGSDLATDASGNAYLTGNFYYTATFDGLSLSSKGGSDVFVAKYDGNGIVQWAKGAGSTTYDYSYGIATTASNEVYIVGSNGSNSTFDGTMLVQAGAFLWKVQQ